MTDPAKRSDGRFARLVRRAAKSLETSERLTGRPPSANGASSFHLVWELPPGLTAAEVAVTLVVAKAPRVPRLYFWALQASFPCGAGAHLGLQWGADWPRRMRHVNWGGYERDGSELSGTSSALTSSFSNPNTRDYEWETGRPHRLRIFKDGGGWAGSVDGTVVRRLHVGGDTLVNPMVWSEVFADCDHPTVAVQWSEPTVVTSSGQQVPIEAAIARYQSHRDGGCGNTSSTVEGNAFVQTTSTPRRTPAGTRLALPMRTEWFAGDRLTGGS